jgi:protein O-mannosyl-transferase
MLAMKSAQPAQHTLLICLLLAALTFVVYSRALRNGFIDYDDRVYITENPHVQAGPTIETMRWAFSTYSAGNWHPLTWISHAIDAQMFGLQPAGHHFISIVFHALNAVLLFLLLWKATGYQGRSLAVAALFAVHPLNVECVAWAAERKSVLSAFFFFLAIGAYGWYAKRPSVKRYVVCAALFALGLLAKPMIITLPCVLLLLDYWPLQRIQSWTSAIQGSDAIPQKKLLNLLLEKIPLLLLSTGSAVTTLIAQSRAQAVLPLANMSFLSRLENATCAYVLYLIKGLLPLNLGVFYPESAAKLLSVLLAALFMCAVSIWVWRKRKKHPYLIVGWLWYLGALVPMIGLVQVGLQSMADRYAYIPLIGVFVMAVCGLTDAAGAIHSPAPRLRLQISTLAVVLIVFSFLTWRQLKFWHDPVSLWSRAIEVTGNNYLAEANLGLALLNRRNYDNALAHFSNAVRIKPDEAKAHIAIASILLERDPQNSIKHSQTALQFTKDPVDLIAIYTNLGVAYLRTGDLTNAAHSFQQVLQREPSNTPAMLALGKILLQQAAGRLEKDLEQHPTADGFTQLGNLWEQAGDFSRAKQAYRSAVQLDSKASSAQASLKRLMENSL